MCFFITELKKLQTKSLESNNQVIIGLDIGDKTLGIAVSDRRLKIASGVAVVQRQNVESDLMKFQELLKPYDIGAIVFGWPVQMNGVPGSQCEKILSFVESLYLKFKIPCFKWDERYSTCAVDRVLIQADMSRKKRKKVIDKSASIYILQGALDFVNRIGTVV
ncbi:MAG: Holliday junction resolvase RuvX [Alphaproteobacteria bacterium]|nr:Holliday junction resolvase RuvX [Alphaproteobacteria bacterium]